MKVGFLGGGNMASALIGGMRAQGFAPSDIVVVELQAAGRERLQQAFGVTTVDAPVPALLGCDVIVLAVKPQQMKQALAPLAGQLGSQLVISIAAGLRTADLTRWLGGHGRIVRCMPNTPALIGAGTTGLYADPSVSDEQKALATRILEAVGSAVWVADEGRMDAITALSGSGPAYVFRFIEALEAAGGELGLEPATARRLALDTVLGAARLAAGSEEPPATLRERVTSPGGTTQAALESFARDDLMGIVSRALQAAERRGQELGDQLGQG